MKTKKPPAEPDLDAIAEALTDDQLKKLLSMRLRLIKEEMVFGLILHMRETLNTGVQIVFNGQIMEERRRLSPGEEDRVRRALSQFNPADIGSFLKDADKSAADGLASGDMDLDELSAATASKPER